MSDLPSIAGRMEMTHADFQRACQVMLQAVQEDCCVDDRWVHILCEAVRCSRECCEIATIRPDAQRITTPLAVIEQSEEALFYALNDSCHSQEKIQSALNAIRSLKE